MAHQRRLSTAPLQLQQQLQDAVSGGRFVGELVCRSSGFQGFQGTQGAAGRHMHTLKQAISIAIALATANCRAKLLTTLD